MPRKFPPVPRHSVMGRTKKLGVDFYRGIGTTTTMLEHGGRKKVIPVDAYDTDWEVRTLRSYHAR
jgi:hypothetical protein